MMCAAKTIFLSVAIMEIILHSFGVCGNALENIFLVELKDGTIENAYQLAKENHYKLLKQVRGFPNMYLFEKIHMTNGNGKRSGPVKKSLELDERVLWAAQQHAFRRDKRDLIVLPFRDYRDDLEDYVEYDYLYGPLFNDELWNQQWYMQKTLNESGHPTLDLNVLPVYERGITGNGVRVAVLDDGLEFDHEDLIDNYDPEISWDCNNDVPDPHPNYRDLNNRHGTRCAGEIAMVANNKKCGVGIAYNSKIGGIKLLGGLVYDLIEGMALGFAHDKVDIYSSSWGPTDNGKTLEQPGIFASKALERGVREGRRGLGNIYVWASGNGGARYDNCNCDGYAASIYTITVGSVTQQGDVPWYSEGCASIMAVTHSSGGIGDQMIATTDLGNSCTVKHTGTSASAPLAAGIIALGLEANSHLTWRDVQHIVVRTGEFEPLKNNKGWQKNGAGRLHHTRLGFGLMNADSFVLEALEWETVPKQRVEEIKGYTEPFDSQVVVNNSKIFQNSQNSSRVFFDYWGSQIQFLEHVEIRVNIDCKRRGNLEIYLKSPMGMQVPILEKRIRDTSSDCFKNWKFMSVATWSENPRGRWEMEIFDVTAKGGLVRVNNCFLNLYGTTTNPDQNIF